MHPSWSWSGYSGHASRHRPSPVHGGELPLPHAQDLEQQLVPQLLLSWSVFGLSHCRKTASDYEVAFVQCHVSALKCCLVSPCNDGRLSSPSYMSVSTNCACNVLPFIPFEILLGWPGSFPPSFCARRLVWCWTRSPEKWL